MKVIDVTVVGGNERNAIWFMKERIGIEPISAFYGIEYTRATFMVPEGYAEQFLGLETMERVTKADMRYSDVVVFDIKVRQI